MDQHAAETRLRLFEELPTAGLGWDDDDMEALNDLDDLPGMPMHRQTPPDSPAKRLKRGFEQLELAETPTRNAAAVVVAHAAGEPLAPGFLDSRRTLSDTFVRRVAIVGGTHGNERNGVALAQHFIDCPQHIARPSFECTAMIGNPAAVQANQRYVEVDMNRCFEAHVLEDVEGHSSLEHRRARELNALLGPKRSADPRTDFIIDLHNTTAQTGVALMLAPDDSFAHEVAHHLVEVDPSVVVVEWTRGKADYALLPTVARSGMTFEVGACPWGCLVADRYAQSRRLILSALDFIEAHNTVLKAVPRPPAASLVMNVFTPVSSISYPAGYPMVHPSLQDRDFELLQDGDPIFMSLEGGCKLFARSDYETIRDLPKIRPPSRQSHKALQSDVKLESAAVSCESGDSHRERHSEAQRETEGGDSAETMERGLFPFFINEAAYYETNVAFSLAVMTMRELTVTSKDTLGEALPRL